MISGDMRRAHAELERRLRPFVARRVPPAEVDDVLQDVFLKMQVALSSLRDDEHFGSWIYSIARNTIIDHHRNRPRHIELAPSFDTDTQCDDSSAPSSIERELASYITPYIARLPSPYREALTLTELSGMTQKAAADALGISISAMKSRVQRGREKLREVLEACCRIGVDARGRVFECEPRDAADCRCSS